MTCNTNWAYGQNGHETFIHYVRNYTYLGIMPLHWFNACDNMTLVQLQLIKERMDAQGNPGTQSQASDQLG